MEKATDFLAAWQQGTTGSIQELVAITRPFLVEVAVRFFRSSWERELGEDYLRTTLRRAAAVTTVAKRMFDKLPGPTVTIGSARAQLGERQSYQVAFKSFSGDQRHWGPWDAVTIGRQGTHWRLEVRVPFERQGDGQRAIQRVVAGAMSWGLEGRTSTEFSEEMQKAGFRDVGGTWEIAGRCYQVLGPRSGFFEKGACREVEVADEAFHDTGALASHVAAILTEMKPYYESLEEFDVLKHFQSASVDDVLKKYYDQLGIPNFQRGLVWNNDDMASLLESLYLGTPCGTLIVWQPKDPAKQGIPLRPGAKKLRYVILDGQQRIRSIHRLFGTRTFDAGADDEEGEEPSGASRRVWCLNVARLPRLPADIENSLEDRQRLSRYGLFRFLRNPEDERAQFKHNVIPLRYFFEDNDEQISKYLCAGERTGELKDHVLTVVKERVEHMATRPRFSVWSLAEKAGQNALADVVSLYNRINTGGRRVEAEEVAFASLCQLAPKTDEWLKEVFYAIHGEPEDQTEELAQRDEVLQRQKEKNFGFKLFIRAFIQVCSYHFGSSFGSNAISFSVVDNPAFRSVLAEAKDDLDRLRGWANGALCFVHEVLRDELYCLHCDDLRMLPGITPLWPVFQLLIRFPDLMTTAADGGRRLVAYLTLRLFLDRDLDQRKAIALAGRISNCTSPAQCRTVIEQATPVAGSGDGLAQRFADSNTLQDWYTLLLYWLLRKNGAKDFSYEVLERAFPERRKKMLEKHSGYIQPQPVGHGVAPEKQHIVPYVTLAHLYGIEGPIRIINHPVNNIGNITYISAALNSYETGWGGDWAHLECEPEENRQRHLLGGDQKDAASGLLGQFITAAREPQQPDKTDCKLCQAFSISPLSPPEADQFDKAHHTQAFERFCQSRRQKIADGFASWLQELREAVPEDERLGGLQPQLPIGVHREAQNRIREMRFPGSVAEALIAGLMAGKWTFNSKQSSAEEAVFDIKDKKHLLLGRLRLSGRPSRIRIVPRSTPNDFSRQVSRLLTSDECTEEPREAEGKIAGHWELRLDLPRLPHILGQLGSFSEAAGVAPRGQAG